MEDIIKQIIENDLEDLRGLKISGKVPVDPDFINEMIEELLKSEKVEPASSEASESASAATLPEADYRTLFSKHIRKLKVAVEDEKIVLHFDIQIG